MNRTVPGRNTIPRSDLKRLDSTNRSSLVTSIRLVSSLIPVEVGLFVGFGRRSPRYRLHLGWLAVVAGYESLCACVAAGPAHLVLGTVFAAVINCGHPSCRSDRSTWLSLAFFVGTDTPD